MPDASSPAVYVDSRLHVRLDAFDRDRLDACRRLFLHDNPQLKRWQAYRYSPHRPRESVSTWKQSGGYLHLPRGRAAEALALLGAEPRGSAFDDRRTLGEPLRHRLELSPLVERRGYQLGLVDQAVRRETCLWRSPTASGKTSAAFILIERLQLATLVVVPNRALLDQWFERVSKLFGFRPAVIQGSTKQLGPITVAMQASLLNCPDYVDRHFGLLVCDEAQRFASRTFNEVVERSPARYRLGVSNDEQRADGCEYLLYDQFGPIDETLTVGRDQLLEAGNIVDVAVRLVPTEFRADWYTALEPDEKFRQRARLWDEMTEDAARNAVVLDCARRCLGEGEQVAVLTHRRAHAVALEAALAQSTTVGRLLGSDADRDEFRRTLSEFAAGRARAAVGTYAAIGVGFESHARLARGVFATPVATIETARMQVMQYLGRFARAAEGKTEAVVYLPFDPLVHAERPVRLVSKWVSRCEVLDRDSGAFISARDYLKGTRREKTQRRSQASDDRAEADDLFVPRRR